MALAIGTLRASVARLRGATILSLQSLLLVSVLRRLATLLLSGTVLRLSCTLVRNSIRVTPTLGRGRLRYAILINRLIETLAVICALLLGTIRLNARLGLLTAIVLRRGRGRPSSDSFARLARG